ncbi:MAG: hypothetical protein RKH07_12585 [Gammaproteobacteria bacterium]
MTASKNPKQYQAVAHGLERIFDDGVEPIGIKQVRWEIQRLHRKVRRLKAIRIRKYI